MRNNNFVAWFIVVSFLLTTILVAVLIIVFTKLEQIKPGYVGVSVKKCEGAKVSEKPIPVGYYWRELMCEEIITYPVSMQTLLLSKDPHETDKDRSVMVTSSDGLNINLDVSLSFTLDSTAVPKIYERWRAPISDISQKYIRQTVREGLQLTFARYTAEELYSNKKETARLEVEQTLIEKLKDQGFMIQQFTINRIDPPKQVVDAINAKVAMTQDAQRSQQEVRKKEAEAQQKVATAKGEAEAAKERAAGEAASIEIRAKATAEANRIINLSLTPQLIEYTKAQRWSGILPQVTAGGGVIPMIQLK